MKYASAYMSLTLSSRLLSLALAATVLVSCGVNESTSDTTALAADKNATNVALLFTGDASGIPGVFKDPPNIQKVLTEPSLDLRFLVNKYISKNQSQIEQESAAAARKMLEVSPNGTMLWYFSGHGAENGELIANGGMGFRFESVARAMRQARGDVAFKRLIVLIDACFSGNSVDGNTAITANSGNGVGGGNSFGNNPFGGLFALNGNIVAPAGEPTRIAQDQAVQSVVTAAQPMQGLLYEQFIVIASSRKTELSGDSGQGGTGTLAFLNAIIQMRGNPNATIEQALQATVRNASGQTPVYRVEPENIKNEPLFAELPALQNPISTQILPQQQQAIVVPAAGATTTLPTTTTPQQPVKDNNLVNGMFNAGN